MFGWGKKDGGGGIERRRVPEHLAQRIADVEGIQPSHPPTPWRALPMIAVGGLTGVGFDDNSKFLLIVSSDGLGVIDCQTGEKVARDCDRADDTDEGTLLVEGIGPLAKQKVRIAGILGGGLPNSTHDGWSVDKHPLAWPVDELYLLPPTQTLLWSKDGSVEGIVKLPPTVTEVKAFGFSPDGNVLVVATSSDTMIYRRS
jgi:hypothetical protein